MFGLFEYFRIDIAERHIIHCALIGQVGAILVVTHADSCTSGIFLLADNEACVHIFGTQTAGDQVTETVIADHTAESHFRTQSRSVGGKNSGTAT